FQIMIPIPIPLNAGTSTEPSFLITGYRICMPIPIRIKQN
ncbi:uncharacterized protein METZ01_LOCUS114046, partial [marine metagenome]